MVYKYPHPSLGKPCWLNARVEETLIVQLYSVRATMLRSKRCKQHLGKYHLASLTSACLFHMSDVMFQFLITGL